jgi:flagellar hook protein FlgE
VIEVPTNAVATVAARGSSSKSTLRSLTTWSAGPTYQIPLATVPSADELQNLPGDVFQPSADSGDMLIGFANTGGLGTVQASALEQSTVDMAAELATMIESERNFQVNSKVFQTGADMLDVVVQLKR